MSVFLVYNFQAVEGKSEELLALLQRGRDFALTVEGCEAYEVYQGKEDPHRFVMIERWASVEAQQAHFEKNVKQSGVLEKAAAMMTGPPKGEFYFVR